MLDGENRPGKDFMPKLVKQSFELAFPPAPVRLEDVRREEDEGTIGGFVNQIATHPGDETRLVLADRPPVENLGLVPSKTTGALGSPTKGSGNESSMRRW